MSATQGFTLLALSGLLSGCPAPTTDPAPPPRKPDIPQAPPSALGALAGGTDAAPRPEAALPGAEDPEPAVPAPSGAGGGASPPPEPGAPDGGMAL